MSSGDRAIFMRLGHIRATALSVVGGSFLTLAMLASMPATAQAAVTRLAAANAATNCQVLPASSTPSPSPTPTPTPTPHTHAHTHADAHDHAVSFGH